MSIFSKVPLPRNKRSVFDLSYDNAFTSKMGQLIPCYFEDVIPSDKFKISAAPFVRMSPLSAPIMGRLNVHVHYFFVPYRLLWDDWEKFITGGVDGTAAPLMPYIRPDGSDPLPSSLLDYFGVARTSVTSEGSPIYTYPKVNALWWRAYWKIVDDYFRDENLTPSFFDNTRDNYINTGGGSIFDLPGYAYTMNGQDMFTPYCRAWKKDLFTSALPFAQRGAPVGIPVSPEAELYYNEDGTGRTFDLTASSSSDRVVTLDNPTGSTIPSTGNVVAKASTGSFDINDLREASAIQRFLERNAIGGARYKEQILSHFGVTVPDYRLGRAEFLGGHKTPVLTSQVLQTSQTNSDSILGTQGGHGIAAGSMRPVSYDVKEHGCIIGFCSITPDAYYSQGSHRAYQKFDKFDYFFPYFENLGEQAIKNSEIYVRGTLDDDKEFGYAPRYYEYKHRNNEIHGDFRNSLAYWIPQRIFSTAPALNQDFVQVNPDKESSLNNIFPVKDGAQDQFYCVVSNAVRAVRPISRFSKFKLM